MQKSYTLNYLYIYAWKGISILLNFVSMFIVIPKLAGMPNIYGIYMVCISTTIFLSYADIGFLRAGFKYASEYYAKNKLKEEIKIVGFASFVLFLFVFVFALLFFAASCFPEVLIKNLTNQNEVNIASNLLLIVSVFSFSTVIERFNQTVFGIRLENYIYQKIQITISIVKILSVFYFFNNRYDIVGYFLFFKIMSLIGGVIGCILIKYKYQYDYKIFVKNFRYSKQIFIKTKELAFGSLFLSLMWIIYFQLDQIVIAKLLGAESVAFFGIGFVILTYFRINATTIFGPFGARFNHYVGQKNLVGLKKFYCHVLIITMPFLILPTISAIMLIKPLILCWVGDKYLLSINIAIFLLLSSLPAFISLPSSIIVFALEKIKQLYIINAAMAAIFWLGILITVKYWQVESFAIFKFVSAIVGCIFYFSITIKILEIKLKHFFSKILYPITMPVIFLIILLKYVSQFMPVEKSTINLATVVIAGGIGSLIAIILYYFQAFEFKAYMNKIIKDIWFNVKTAFKQKWMNLSMFFKTD